MARIKIEDLDQKASVSLEDMKRTRGGVALTQLSGGAISDLGCWGAGRAGPGLGTRGRAYYDIGQESWGSYVGAESGALVSARSRTNSNQSGMESLAEPIFGTLASGT